MFIIASGTVKAWVRDPKGRFLKVKELSEGEFFGEISVITGKPRTATITAAGEVEVLELGKTTLDSIVQKHPHIKQVLADYQKKRAQETVSAIIKGRD
jgi:CRP-like cAMP-binding protein